MGVTDMPELARLIAAALKANDAATMAPEVTRFRSKFRKLHFIRAG